MANADAAFFLKLFLPFLVIDQSILRMINFSNTCELAYMYCVQGGLQEAGCIFLARAGLHFDSLLAGVPFFFFGIVLSE